MKKSLFVLAVLSTTVIMSFSPVQKEESKEIASSLCLVNNYTITRYLCGDVYNWAGMDYGICGTYNIISVNEGMADVCIHDHDAPMD